MILKEKIDFLKDAGVPISYLSEMLNIERKMIYENTYPEPLNSIGLDCLIQEYTEHHYNLKYLIRISNREYDTDTLKKALISNDISRITKQLGHLRIVAISSHNRDKKRGPIIQSPAGLLTIDLVAVETF